jgi:LmbE family N-acetylglucosaminyl deacetylase
MKVLVISVHPDDEALGCGGSILRHAAAGDEIYWMVVTEGYVPRLTPEMMKTKALEVEAVAAAYGAKRLIKLGFRATSLDHIPQNDLVDKIREVVSDVRPEIIYQVHGGDIHTDHRAFFTASMSVLKPVRRILCYETLSSTEAAPALVDRQFLPNVYADITPYLERKLEIMKLFASELQPDPFPRGSSAIRALARFRGATISIEYAEAFMLIREVV